MTSTPRLPRSTIHVPLHFVREFLIGLAELVPGISGGTVALVTGVYEHLIDAASHVLAALRRLLSGPQRKSGFAAELRRTDWWLAIPVLAGMALSVLTMAGVMEHLVSQYPENARGAFFGLVAASVLVPLRLIPREALTAGIVVRDVVIVAVSAALAYWLIGLAGATSAAEPAAPVVFIAAAIAVCALVMPGLSGSFFLLAIGLYSPTLQAVDTRDLGYIAVFAAGALVGLGSIVQVLRYLLARHCRCALLAVTGVMVGSLRALWPWPQATDVSGSGSLAVPYEPVVGPVLLAVAGVVVVMALIIAESWMARRSAEARR